MVGPYYLQVLLRRIRCSVSVPTVFVICFPTASSLYISHTTRTNKLLLRASHLTGREIPQNCGYFSTQVATRIKYLGSRANSDLFHSILVASFFWSLSPFLRLFFFFCSISFSICILPTYVLTYMSFFILCSPCIDPSFRPSLLTPV